MINDLCVLLLLVFIDKKKDCRKIYFVLIVVFVYKNEVFCYFLYVYIWIKNVIIFLIDLFMLKVIKIVVER